MNAMAAKEAYENILAHINKQGGAYSNWYAGITSDWEKRLFTEHSVPREDYWWIARQCFTDTDARAVEKALIELGCIGGGGGGDKTSVFVYAYLIANRITRESIERP
jgi:hypothetical protein